MRHLDGKGTDRNLLLQPSGAIAWLSQISSCFHISLNRVQSTIYQLPDDPLLRQLFQVLDKLPPLQILCQGIAVRTPPGPRILDRQKSTILFNFFDLLLDQFEWISPLVTEVTQPFTATTKQETRQSVKLSGLWRKGSPEGRHQSPLFDLGH